MFENFLASELTKRIGTPIEVALSDGFVEGIITSVTGNLLTILQTVGYGYGNTTTPLTISIPSINFVTFSPAG
ncbi:hypothetical protein CCZ20_26210 [Priestia aryabhattai]|uniref:hypothetical protein n=1 Tax=Priestia aryabhattai TaxID=412384 RepID=UPI000B5129EC|nr:hypothetical protein [Priestia aryabhattai]OVE34523.1 hypothetical protein CCZ20_26210 [Priestia aryabhattai]